MILTVTMNPSVDMAYQAPDFILDAVNRVATVTKTAGGKGLNVTRVLHQLAVPVKATGIVGGHLGAYIMENLQTAGIDYDFYQIQKESRNSIAILHGAGLQTELLEQGPVISETEQAGFLQKYQTLLKTATTVTISGSLSPGLPAEFYQKLLTLATENKCKVLLDTSGKPLKAALSGPNKPTLIKPNETEIAELLGNSPEENTFETLKEQLKQPIFADIPWIVVSRGSQGAIAKFQNRFFVVTIPKIQVVNPVGSGDATLAGMASVLDRQGTPEEVLKTGMTTGMLNALETATGSINPELFTHYYQQIQIIEK